MLSCHSCMRHCLQSIIGRPLQLPARTIHTPRPILKHTSRVYNSSYAAIRQDRGAPRRRTDDIAVRGDSFGLQANRFEENRQQWLKSRGVRPPSSKKRKPNLDTEVAMRKHLQYLQDPVKLSDYIRTTLRDDDFETAEKVVHFASKKMQCVVSWNHLVDWQLSKGKMNAAIKTYNDMKKRAQTPDAHTYTIIFRGCAAHKDSTQALEKVLAIYHSMSADNCPVKPNTIHVNAVLKMCAKAGNMDAMFAIADHLPETGLRAPNNLTYTTIMNGLRSKVPHTGRGVLTNVQQRNEIQKAILTARHIWTDIVRRWRKGDIWIDEELVCSMGRLMLLGNDRDADDILSLVEQTMSIPRQIPAKQYMPPPSLKAVQPKSDDPSQPTVESLPAETKPEDEEVISFTEPITPVQAPKGVSPYPIPGCNTLSLLLAALLKQKGHSSAPKAYWDLLTSPPYSVIPDKENYAAFLRTLRVTRSSTSAIQLLSQMPKEFMSIGTFRIAISTCLRDKNNQHAFANAGKLLDYMQTSLHTIDPKVLESYLELAVTAPVAETTIPGESNQFSAKPSEEELAQQNRSHGRIISRALHRLGPAMINLRSVLSWGNAETGSRPLQDQSREEYTVDVMRLMQRMISAYTILMDKGMVERADYVSLSAERSKIASFLQRLKHRRSEDEEDRTDRIDKEKRLRRVERARDTVIEHRKIRTDASSE